MSAALLAGGAGALDVIGEHHVPEQHGRSYGGYGERQQPE
jgi:hypothetical protein